MVVSLSANAAGVHGMAMPWAQINPLKKWHRTSPPVPGFRHGTQSWVPQWRSVKTGTHAGFALGGG